MTHQHPNPQVKTVNGCTYVYEPGTAAWIARVGKRAVRVLAGQASREAMAGTLPAGMAEGDVILCAGKWHRLTNGRLTQLS